MSLLYLQSKANWALIEAKGKKFHLWDAAGGSGAHDSRVAATGNTGPLEENSV